MPATHLPTDLMRLQLNTRGAWRNLVDFSYYESPRVLDAAVILFSGDKHAALRVMSVGSKDTAPLMRWTVESGWKLWDERHDNQA